LLKLPVEDVVKLLLLFALNSSMFRWCGGWDLNPRRPTPSGPQPCVGRGEGGLGKAVLKQDEEFSLEPSASKLAAFNEWCLERASEEQCRGYIRYLSRPLDTSNRWSITSYKRYYRWLCEERGLGDACKLFKSLKSRRSRPDLYVPSLEEVLETLGKAEEPYRTVYRVLLESGLRLREAVYLLRSIDGLKTVRLGGFTRVELNLERRSKKAFWAYLLEDPPHILITDREVSEYARRNKLLAPKYVRKFVATQMAKLGIPESAIDFIQGRTPDKIIRKHYLNLLAIADQHYPKYAEWLRGAGLRDTNTRRHVTMLQAEG